MYGKLFVSGDYIVNYGFKRNESEYDYYNLNIMSEQGALLETIETINGHRLDKYEPSPILYPIPETSLFIIVRKKNDGDLMAFDEFGNAYYRVRGYNIMDVYDLDELKFQLKDHTLPTYDTTIMKWVLPIDYALAGVDFWDYQYPTSFAKAGSSLVYYADISGYVSSFNVQQSSSSVELNPTDIFFFNPLEICDGRVFEGGPSKFNLVCDYRYEENQMVVPRIFYYDHKIITFYGSLITSATHCQQ